MNSNAELITLNAELERLKGEHARKDTEIQALKTKLQKVAEGETDIDDECRAMIYMSEKQYKMVIQTAMDGFWMMDAQARLLDVNEAYCNLTGYSRDELLTMSVADLEAAETPKVTSQHIRQIIKRGCDHFESRHRCKNGRIIDIEVSVNYLEIEGGRFFAFIRDITGRKGTEERLREEAEVAKNLMMINKATAYIIDIDKLVGQVVQCVWKITKCDMSLFYLWDNEAKVFKPGSSCGLTHEMIPLFRTEALDDKVKFVRKALEEKKPIVVKTHSDASLQWIKDVQTMVVIPIIGRRGIIGLIIGIYQRRDALQCVSTGKDMEVMEGIAHQVSTVLEEKRLYKEAIDKETELSHKIETIQVMHEIDRSILSTLETQEILETITSRVTRVVPAESVTVVLVDRERGGFVYKAGLGIKLAKGDFISFGDTSATEVIQTGMPQFTSDIASEKDRLPLERALLDEGYHAYIRVPLTSEDAIVGLFNVGSKKVGAFVSEHLAVLERLAAQTSVALKNARLVTELKDMFLGTITTLSSAIDAKSPWTAGHSKRVTRYALDIGKEMGLPAKDLKDLEMAGLLHDIGKLGTYQAILDKSYKLTEKETKVLRLHPAKGAEILFPIKQMREIIPAIRHHHEFYNGEGYPDGLKGEEIPLMARILCVADSVDAMSADRPYRKGKLMNVIIAELKHCSGTQFDPKVVNVFVKMAESGKLS